MKLALLCCALTLTSCVTFGLRRTSVDAPIEDATLAALEPGAADLTACLDHLGAPHLVWELHGDGLALAYAWYDGFGWGFTVSGGRWAPGTRFSFDTDSVDRNGVVLTFSGDLVLQDVRRGYLKDLVPRRRPSPLAEDL